ncbi:hypothetical protein EV360DRAFT_69672, partial [Lentinula raphanica]
MASSLPHLLIKFFRRNQLLLNQVLLLMLRAIIFTQATAPNDASVNASILQTSGPVNWMDVGKSLPPLVPKHTKQVMIKKLCITEAQRKQIIEIYKGDFHFMHKLCCLNLVWIRVLRKNLRAAGVSEIQPSPYLEIANEPSFNEVIEKSNGVITWVAGVPEHNEACKASFLEQRPPVPLHEHVYEITLDQLKDGASITAIQDKNRQMMAFKLYRGRESYDSLTANVRYLFLLSDHASLYRKATKGVGVDSRQLPQNNVEDWLNPTPVAVESTR